MFFAGRCIGLIPISFAFLAVLCCFVSNFYCDSVRFNKLPSNADNDSDSDSATSDLYDNVALGPWYWKKTQVDTITDAAGNRRVFVRDVCVQLPGSVNIDATWKAVRAFSIMAPLIGGLATFLLAIVNCLYFLTDSQWKALAAIFAVVLTLFQGLTFLIFQSNACSDNPIYAAYPSDAWSAVYESDCSWGGASTANVFSVALYFLTGLAMLKVGPPRRAPRAPPETQAVTYTQTVNPDGTTTVAETQVVKGTAVPSSPAAETPDEKPLETPLEKV